MQGVFSILGPVISSMNYHLHSSRSQGRNLRHYMWTNLIFNLMIHFYLWLIMIFLACWGVKCIESSNSVSQKLSSLGPTILILHVFTAIITFLFEKEIIMKKNVDVITNVVD